MTLWMNNPSRARNNASLAKSSQMGTYHPLRADARDEAPQDGDDQQEAEDAPSPVDDGMQVEYEGAPEDL
eukprot:6490249-Amphidinium_carterae.2